MEMTPQSRPIENSAVMDSMSARSKGVSQALVAPATEAPSESELVFDQLYRSSRDDVYAYAAGLLRDRAAAEEVTAIAFERAYRKRGRFDPGRGSARAWLFGIARNAALDELRRRGRQAELAADPRRGEHRRCSPKLGPSSRGLSVRLPPLPISIRSPRQVRIPLVSSMQKPQQPSDLPTPDD
jgi:RNA polymerase sigma factor (sigma-70 family)